MNLYRLALVFSAATLSLSAAREAEASVDIAGVWIMDVRSVADEEPIQAKFTLQLIEETIIGYYEDGFGTAAVSGSLDNHEVTLTFRVDFPEEAQEDDFEVTYLGTVEGTAMSGRVVFGNKGKGLFTGRKQ